MSRTCALYSAYSRTGMTEWSNLVFMKVEVPAAESAVTAYPHAFGAASKGVRGGYKRGEDPGGPPFGSFFRKKSRSPSESVYAPSDPDT